MLHFYNMETLNVLCVISLCCIPENWVNLTVFSNIAWERVLCKHASFHLSSPHCQSHPIPRPFFCPAFMSTSEINKPCYFAARIIRIRSCPYHFFGTTCSFGVVLICTQIGVFLGSLRFTLSKNFPKAAHPGHPVLSAQSSPALFFAFAFYYWGGLIGALCVHVLFFFPLSFCFGLSIEGSRKRPVLSPPKTLSCVPVAFWLLCSSGQLASPLWVLLPPSPSQRLCEDVPSRMNCRWSKQPTWGKRVEKLGWERLMGSW